MWCSRCMRANKSLKLEVFETEVGNKTYSINLLIKHSTVTVSLQFSYYLVGVLPVEIFNDLQS